MNVNISGAKKTSNFLLNFTANLSSKSNPKFQMTYIEMQGLSSLDLSHITLSSSNCMQLSSLLARPSSKAPLRELILQNCRIRGESAKMLLEGLERNTNIQSLNIS